MYSLRPGQIYHQDKEARTANQAALAQLAAAHGPGLNPYNIENHQTNETLLRGHGEVVIDPLTIPAEPELIYLGLLLPTMSTQPHKPRIWFVPDAAILA